MAYITNADIEERLGHATYVQLTDDEGTGMPDEDKVSEARLAAEGEADSYVGRRYRVPVDVIAHPEVAGVLKSIALDLAEYRLYARRPPAPADVKILRDAAVQWLERVADGRIVLPSVEELEGPRTGGIAGQGTGRERLLTRETMENL